MGNGLSTSEDIGSFVAKIGQAYEPYKELIIINAVDLELLNDLDEGKFDQVLQEIGITLLTHRKVLYLRYKELTSTVVVPSASIQPHQVGSVDNGSTRQVVAVNNGSTRKSKSVDKGVYEGELDSKGNFCGKGKLKYKDGRCFTGDFQDNLFHGHGTWICPGVLVYTGEFKNGLFDGTCTVVYDDGDRFEGTYENDEKVQGKQIFANGEVYSGDWRGDIRHGHGKYIWPDGESYDGEWKNNIGSGFAIYKYSDGKIYEGNFKDDDKNGKGKMTYPDKKTFVGEWFADKMEGPGKEIDPNKKSFKIGEWKNDDFAYGLTFSFGSPPDGSGIICNEDTSIYEGTWKDHKMEGYGKYIWPSFDDERTSLTGEYEGNWLQGQMNGYGKRSWADGDYYEGIINITLIFIHIISYNYFTGEFKNGLQHGKGHYKSIQYEYEGG